MAVRQRIISNTLLIFFRVVYVEHFLKVTAMKKANIEVPTQSKVADYKKKQA